ncbi:MAG: conjugative transposon protein TraK [Bacteroidota bacterium]
MALIKTIEQKMKLAFSVVLITCIACIIMVCVVCVFAFKSVESSRQSIYVLDHDVPILAKQTNMLDNRPAEYKADVELFHSIFFSLTPDNAYIQSQMKKAMFLVDESGVAQYNNLKEAGFFNSILSSSAVITLTTDSIQLDVANKHFMYYGKQRIERASDILTRSLITEGYLRDIPRSDNNPHGVLITKWKTIENKNLENNEKTNL